MTTAADIALLFTCYHTSMTRFATFLNLFATYYDIAFTIFVTALRFESLKVVRLVVLSSFSPLVES